MKKICIGCVLALAALCCKKNSNGGGSTGGGTDTSSTTKTDSGFANPISPYADPDDFADPSVVFQNGYYYYVRSSHASTQLDVYKSSRLERIYYDGNKSNVFVAPASGDHCAALWAPELKYIAGYWYIYYTATTADGSVANHRMFVLKSNTQDPQGSYTDMGLLSTPAANGYAIDGNVLVKPADSSLYFVWSGGLPSQRLYIAPMSDPLHLSGNAVELGGTMLAWENGINEAPAFLYHGTSTFVSYSTGYVTSASATAGYKLGLLYNGNGNYLDSTAWVKRDTPVLQYYSGYDGTVWSPGSNAFVSSPDGKESWIVYHAKHAGDDGVYDRELHIQKFSWDANGQPVFGHPIPAGILQTYPGGE